MSKLIAAGAIRGAHEIVAEAEERLAAALAQHGPQAAVGFPNTAYYLPVIYAVLGHKVEKLADAKPVLERCRSLCRRCPPSTTTCPTSARPWTPAWPPSSPRS